MKKEKEQAVAKTELKNTGSGIQLNKKTVIGITILLFAIMIFAGILTQIIPTGAYDVDADGGIIPGTYHTLAKDEVDYPFWRIFIAPLEVFTNSDALAGVAIMIFIVLIGGTFLVLDKSGVLKYIMTSVVKKFEKKKYILLMAMCFVCMALSSVVGILEESLTLVPLACAITLALGWDSIVGLGISMVSIGFGYAAATFNPFNISLVQTMAGLPMFSGLGYRIIVFLAMYAVLVTFIVIYAKRIEKNPEKSLSYKTDIDLRKKYLSEESDTVLQNPNLGKATKTFIICILSVFVVTAISFAAQQMVGDATLASYISYIPMVAMIILFTAGGLRAGKISGMNGKELAGNFGAGIKTIAPCIPLILFVLAITYILKRGMIIDTILYNIYNAVQGFGATKSLLIIFAVVIILEFFIGSGTAKAFLLMPLVLPLADMLAIERQTIVLAFCLGDGLCNVLYPTSGLLIIGIGLVNVPYRKYLRFMWPVFLTAFAIAIGFIILAQKIGYC